ncbi:LysR family transcriptional regulator [Paraburkholderia oxyphila]|uniref:LysR family transcriptional regulator n=1 Tax=Paraburkholderia oxyphila TaxID=614212 RepID=UPI001428B178|nr:LysR family transcriptional regulator [Paraburkholderia oxyphila]
MMELRQLRYFLALARTLNFTHAAAESHIAQPPFSRQIRALEEELGIALVDRRSRQLTLTVAGELVQQRASEILARIDRLSQEARHLERTGQRSFRIGLETIVLYGRFPELLRELRAANPHAKIDLVEMPAGQQVVALKEGRIDIGFGHIRVSDPEISQVHLRQEPLFVAVSAHHPLAINAPEPLSLRDLADQTFIVFPTGASPEHPGSVHALFAERGFRPSEIIDVGELQVALGLVAADYGICIVPAVVQRMRGSDVCYRLLDEPGCTSPILMSWLRSEQPALMNSINELLGRILNTLP